jgi:hypothetical protein
MSITTNLQVNQSIIPCIPFIWYREQELVCPIDYVGKMNFLKVKELFDINNINNVNDNEEVYITIQKNIVDGNLYVCLHSLLYYELHKSEIQNDLLILQNNYVKIIPFEVMIYPLPPQKEGESDIQEIPGGLKINQFVFGSVFIHNCAFSPPGCLHFRVNLEKQHNIFLCNIKCAQININIYSLFILFNDIEETNVDESIKNMIIEIMKLE